MDPDRHKMATSILNLTLEIICLLTGEDYATIKKKFDKFVAPSIIPNLSGGWERRQSPIMEPYSQVPERNMEQKILELTHKILELLSGEVPIRCQDVSVYFSLEEWDYIEGHKDLYKDIMMEEHQDPPSPDGSNDTGSPQRWESPLNLQDCSEEDQCELQDDEIENLVHIKVEVLEGEEEEMYVGCGDIKEEDVPVAISPGSTDLLKGINISHGHLYLAPDCKVEDPAEDVFPSFPDPSDAWEDSLDSPDVTECKVYPCLDCGKCYSRKGNLLIHQRVHTGEKLYTCNECGRSFVYKAYLIEHKRMHGAEKTFSCSDCGKCFKQKSYYFKHRRSHMGVKKRFSCSDCGKRFKDRWTLDRHERIHTGEKPFSCPECGKSFTQKYSFLEHQKIHTGEKPFPCPKCGQRFTRKSKLVRHERVHTGEKPFSCAECGKCFALKTTLEKHQRVHTGEKPFPCSVCGKCFTQKYDVVEHQKIHTGEKPFACAICGKGFIRRSKLTQHERIHTGEKPFSCMECGKCFTQKPGLAQHQKTHRK